MPENPNIIATDDDGNELSDASVEVNGIVPGEGADGGGLTTTVIDSESTTSYVTQDEDIIYVDTSSAAVTVTLASDDATLGTEIQLVNVSGTNPVAVDTEGSETIDPGAEASKSIGKAGWSVGFVSDGSDWDSSLEGEFETLRTERLQFAGPDGTTGVGWAQDLLVTSNGDYWNVGDGVTDAEAGTKLQAAVDSIGEAEWLFVPPRTYLVDLVVGGDSETPERTIWSPGRQSATIEGDTSHAIEVEGANAYRLTVQNISFRTPSGGGNAADAIHINDVGTGNPVNIKFDNCHVQESDRDALHIDGANRVVFEGFQYSTAGDIDRNGIYIDNSVASDIDVRMGSEGTEGGAAIEAGAGLAKSNIHGQFGKGPVVNIAAATEYNYFDLKSSASVDLTFLSGSSRNTVKAMRFNGDTYTNNGATSNSVFQYFNDGGFIAP